MWDGFADWRPPGRAWIHIGLGKWGEVERLSLTRGPFSYTSDAHPGGRLEASGKRIEDAAELFTKPTPRPPGNDEHRDEGSCG